MIESTLKHNQSNTAFLDCRDGTLNITVITEDNKQLDFNMSLIELEALINAYKFIESKND